MELLTRAGTSSSARVFFFFFQVRDGFSGMKVVYILAELDWYVIATTSNYTVALALVVNLNSNFQIATF